MKAKITLLILLGLCQTTFAKTANLTVVNNWSKEVRVQEGFWAAKEGFVRSGKNLIWTLYTGTITNLAISSYSSSGSWQQIPGCPQGAYNTGLTVYIRPAPGNPDTAICHSEIAS